MTRSSSLDVKNFSVGWICSLLIEYIAACNVLDEIYPDTTHVLLGKGDCRAYTLGRIGKHNVVIVCLPAESPGVVSASTVETTLRITFPSIRFSLMVGIAGAAAGLKEDVRLGDVVIGTRIVPYEFGKVTHHGFQYTGHCPRPPAILNNRVNHFKYKSLLELYIGHLVQDKARLLPVPLRHLFRRPELEDRLYNSDYVHTTEDCDCEKMMVYDSSLLVAREPRLGQDGVRVHSGTIASGDKLIKNAQTRNDWGSMFNALCFDMESAGLSRGSLTIRGIDNYSDSHKCDRWQGYAAMAAAVCAAEFLKMVPISDIPQGQIEIMDEVSRVMTASIKEMKSVLDSLPSPGNNMTTLMAVDQRLGAMEHRLALLDTQQRSAKALETKLDMVLERLNNLEKTQRQMQSYFSQANAIDGDDDSFPYNLTRECQIPSFEMVDNSSDQSSKQSLAGSDTFFKAELASSDMHRIEFERSIRPTKPLPPPKPIRFRSRPIWEEAVRCSPGGSLRL
ncbi:purine and uridine phosphorylase [Aspergillus eucalypticola CBS 122712]|uniref:Purine and uridine phosphorylase n=1 Tax=Aspergillus eucalypticola (strain CBS 122712 / IBT 29274) TaxID=1448314 RepID=A0A317VCT6_ASPEC|nr:purine and uridine phosphorylase [Aspergillus eucalypticola CBS 122712]PWY71239.1 purine and uridine phosphorylase [Aspergillus eucalypticola CBS 122712]